MLSLKLITLDKKSVTYDYSPEDREAPGRITIDRETQEVIYAKKSEFESGHFDMYFIHAIRRVMDNIKQDEYPKQQFVGW